MTGLGPEHAYEWHIKDSGKAGIKIWLWYDASRL